MIESGQSAEVNGQGPARPFHDLPPAVLAEAVSADAEHDRWNQTMRGETSSQRVTRNYHELLQELRVAQIGVQVLFAFLLTCAFSPRFTTLTDYQRGIFVTALLLTIVAASLLTAPAAYHRVLFRLRLKGHIVEAANRFAIAGLAVLVFAVSSGLLLVLDMAMGHGRAIALTGAVVTWFGYWWYALPMSKRITQQDVRTR